MAALLVILLAHPHSAPAAWCDTDIKDDEVTLTLTVRRDVLGPWLELDLDMGEPPRDALVALFEGVLTLDGRPATADIRTVEVPADLDDPNQQEYLRIVAAYPCTTPPRRVTVLWKKFEGADWQGEPVVPGRVLHAPATDALVFSADEPEFTWHRKDPPAPVAPVAGAPPARPVPFFSLALFGAGALGALLLRRRPNRAVVALLAGGFLAALAFPTVAARARVPAAPEARALFATLHENLYRAFDAATEGEIYDLLATSIAAPLLPKIYLDVYESLILRDQGGAVTRVERVEVVDGRVDLPADPDADHFRVFWKWEVHCSVAHWGHTHRRINAYAADFTVRHDGRSWKIADMAVRDYERIDPDDGPR